MPLVGFLAVLFVGMAIENENAPQPVESLSDLVHSVELTIEEVKEREGFVSHKLND